MIIVHHTTVDPSNQVAIKNIDIAKLFAGIYGEKSSDVISFLKEYKLTDLLFLRNNT